MGQFTLEHSPGNTLTSRRRFLRTGLGAGLGLALVASNIPSAVFADQISRTDLAQQSLRIPKHIEEIGFQNKLPGEVWSDGGAASLETFYAEYAANNNLNGVMKWDHLRISPDALKSRGSISARSPFATIPDYAWWQVSISPNRPTLSMEAQYVPNGTEWLQRNNRLGTLIADLNFDLPVTLSRVYAQGGEIRQLNITNGYRVIEIPFPMTTQSPQELA